MEQRRHRVVHTHATENNLPPPFVLMRFMLTQTAQIYLLIGKITEHNRVNETLASKYFNFSKCLLFPLCPCLTCFNQQKCNYHLGLIALTENIKSVLTASMPV